MRLDDFHEQVSGVRGRLAGLGARIAGAGSDPLLQEALEELRTAFEELQVSDEELRQQNESLVAAQLLLEEEHARYAELFHSAPEAYLVSTPDGSVREANRAAAELLGVRPTALVGKPLAVFVAPAHLRPFREQVNRVASGGEAAEF